VAKQPVSGNEWMFWVLVLLIIGIIILFI